MQGRSHGIEGKVGELALFSMIIIAFFDTYFCCKDTFFCG